MNQRQMLINFFGRFYELVARPHLHNTVADSEWTHFNGMLHSQKFEPDRIEFYLNMLEHEQKSKKQGAEIGTPAFLQYELPAKRYTTLQLPATQKLFSSLQDIANKQSEPLFCRLKETTRHYRTESVQQKNRVRQPLSHLDPNESKLAKPALDITMIRSVESKAPSTPMNYPKKKMREMLVRLLDQFQGTQARLM